MNSVHFWKFNPKGNHKNYKLALLTITNLIDSSFMVVANGRGDPNSQPFTSNGIIFNGVAPDCAELFFLPKSLDLARGMYSCNTKGLTYDQIVTASLVILQDCMLDDIKIYSDASYKSWSLGAELAGGLDFRIHSMEEIKHEAEF
jgi:hypothetical protein